MHMSSDNTICGPSKCLRILSLFIKKLSLSGLVKSNCFSIQRCYTHTHTHTHTHNDSDEVCVLKRYVSALSPHTCKCDVNWKKRGVVCRYKDFNLRYFQIVVLEKTLESPLDSKELKPVNPKGNQP